jgi:hypothetical protein
MLVQSAKCRMQNEIRFGRVHLFIGGDTSSGEQEATQLDWARWSRALELRGGAGRYAAVDAETANSRPWDTAGCEDVPVVAADGAWVMERRGSDVRVAFNFLARL